MMKLNKNKSIIENYFFKKKIKKFWSYFFLFFYNLFLLFFFKVNFTNSVLFNYTINQSFLNMIYIRLIKKLKKIDKKI